MPITCKFGGSSLADATQIKKVAAIVKADSNRRFIVVSAPGKRTQDDKKITDLLYLCHSLVQQGLNPAFAFDVIRERYMAIADALGVPETYDWLGEVQLQTAAGADKDWVASRGEWLCAKIVAQYLGATFVDASEAIVFSAEGRFRADETYERLAARLNGPGLFAIPGFYGQDVAGKIRCFSRGGSDITGAIVARAVGADVYENWTDVSGLLMADPRLIESPKPIAEVTYREQRELSYMGATVLHDEAVFPVREAGIPIHIRNTNEPKAAGTKIVTTRDSSKSTIVGVAGRKGFATLFTEKALMNAEVGYGRRMLEILERHGIPYEHAPTSIDSMSVIVRGEDLDGKEEQVTADIQGTLKPDRMEILKDLALIATVGEGMIHKVGMAGRLFAALAKAGINIRMIDQGASEINIIIGVADSDYEKALRAIYAAFVE
ncbi:MAG TPA: aspartate kinase [Capsulimonadaceae bacterium]|nr:aspartate kinase [Capsulimonadaceae bacterium]